jgi:hypothetical protein
MTDPAVSVVVIVFRMPRQAMNTVYTLTSKYQRSIPEGEFEIIVVENRSQQCLSAEHVHALGGNVRYFLRDETSQSPAAAINFGFGQARAPIVGLLIDGARMVTPGVLHFARRAFQAYERPLVIAPGYHLGQERQWKAAQDGYNEEEEQLLLARIDWRSNGYALFSISRMDETNENGYFNPLLESNCIFFRRECFDEIGGANEDFQSVGGGILNLAIFNSLCELPDTKLVVLPGEGSFHQYHGGVSTSPQQDREALLESFRDEYRRICGPYRSPDREPVILGQITPEALNHLRWAAFMGVIRADLIQKAGRVEWPRG